MYKQNTTCHLISCLYEGLSCLFDCVDDTYGVEDDDSAVEDEYTVHISPNRFSLAEEHLAELRSSVNPLAESSNFGIDLYLETLTLLCTIVTNNPNLYTGQS